MAALPFTHVDDQHMSVKGDRAHAGLSSLGYAPADGAEGF
jgi:hypothetical protein